MAGTSVVVDLLLKGRDQATSVIQRVTQAATNLGAVFAAAAKKMLGFVLPDFGDSTEAANKLEVQMGKLRAAVEATGGAAGLTAEDIDAMARRLDEATLGSAEGFRNAALELLTFKSVGIDAFERTLMAAQDLADAGFGTVESATVQLGKALEDPVKGLTALTRVGVSFTEEQRAMIENFVKLGDVASAQNVILAAVEGQVKGVASAAGGGLAGAVDLVGKRMTDLKETIGGVLLPILTTLNLAWADVIGAVQKTASGLTGTLKAGAEQAGGAIKSLAAGIGEFISGAVKDLADWVAHLDWSNVQAAANATKEKIAQLGTALSDMGSAGTKAVAILSVGFNAIQSGFCTLAAGLLAITSGVVSTLATVEEAASKIGLGSLERAKELRETANNMAGAAEDITAKIAENGDAIKRAYDTLTGATDAAADAQKRLKDALPALELQTLNKSLADYEAIAQRAAVAAKQAQQDFFAGKITMEQLADAAEAATSAHADLEDATLRAAEAAKTGATAGQQAAFELQAVAKASQDAANQQGNYTSALEQASNANTAAIRAEIDLALAKGDVATAAAKSVQLAQSEADWAQRIAVVAKATEAAELQKVVVAQQAYLAAVGGGTATQQQELQILQLKVSALQAEAAQAGATAQTKALATQQTQQQTQQTQQNTEQTQQNTQAVQANSDAQETNTQHVTDTTDANKLLAQYLAGTRSEMDELSGSARRYFEAIFQSTLVHQGFIDSYKSAVDAQRAFISSTDDSSAALVEYRAKFLEAVEAEDQASEKLLFAMNGFRKAEAAIELAAAKTKAAYYEQAAAAEALRLRLEDMGSSGVNATNLLSYAAKQADGAFSLLDEQDLSGLRAAIDDANDKLREMQEETQSARDYLAELNAEIADESGDTEKAALLKQQLDYQQALADIEAKRSQAELEGNRELVALYDEQARKLTELNALKVKNIKADAESSADTTSSTSSTTTSSSASGGVSTGKTHRLELIGVNGRTLTATTDTDPTSFLDELERAQQSAS